MQHLVLTRFGEPEDSVELVDGPEPSPGAGQVSVRLEAAAINPSDLLLIRGKYLARPEPPATVGGEGVGIVDGAGSGVHPSIIGKRVILLPTYEFGTWSQRVVVSRDDVVEVPADADPVQLAMVTINPPTAHLLLEEVSLGPGDWIGQTAANSAVGRLVVALARRRGLKTLNVVRREDAATEVREAGGDAVVISGPNAAADIARTLGDQRLRLVLDPLGGSHAAELVDALEFRGTTVTYGSLTGAPAAPSTGALLGNEVRYTGFWLGNWYRRTPRPEVVSTLSHLAGLVVSGDLSVPVESTYPLRDYQKAFAHTQTTQRGGKVLFTFND
ncbi:trans-2-enoyl-CoA reductase [Mycobacterium sp. 852013-50091_SCH5140682]|uniref:zinc-dependent alcohol dehydrogenase family protein n=1 Tax=Mycobacterium sp. 852013-50091_SCH5140682 TaxID=1834109 RepID=UPI0007E96FDF|nr:zinc-dependent alcohol dehydrogenase family protein [Mycobacterium sp. 852013-50091_SCH5140682]OBC04865.1 trans-2-enoyl-CoA reductase [Mycobacterium sp. 852013-50091_SCH5140682]